MPRRHSLTATVAVAAVVLWPLTVVCWLGWATASAAAWPGKFEPPQKDLSVAPAPYDTEVQDLLAPALAMGLGPMGGSVYVSTNPSNSNASALLVCARADAESMPAPVTVTTIDALFHSMTGVSGQLDVNNGCYMEHTEDSVPQCVAALTSTAEDCGGIAEDAVAPHLRDGARATDRDSTSSALPGVMPSSAAMLAAYVRDWGQQRLRLERSLRRTREVTAAFARVHALVQNAAAVPFSDEETRLLRARATARVAEIVSAAYDRVMDKYYIFNMWVGPSLGIVPEGSSSDGGGGPHDAVGPDVAKCDVDKYMRLLLLGNESSAVLLE
ncbi:hypothetical predicted transmembrane protein [Leishmania tarentolae]|uniref:Hypothetical predicted transmembrane protein n=1 Tax=Leishmania tarentolae TaxID=5689 RepID=A0A640KIW0_LEITA|nr:hypothetical predicted transmembrane protein [Leishmania tarentolae]